MGMAATFDRSIHSEKNKIWRSYEKPDRRYYRTQYQSVVLSCLYHTAASAGHISKSIQQN